MHVSLDFDVCDYLNADGETHSYEMLGLAPAVLERDFSVADVATLLGGGLVRIGVETEGPNNEIRREFRLIGVRVAA